MRIKEVSALVGVSTRLLRYYEEQGLVAPVREENGYRFYDDGDVVRVDQIRGLLGAGLTTDIIRGVLPCLTAAAQSQYDAPEFVARVVQERDRLQERFALLSHNLSAMNDYLDAVADVVSSRDRIEGRRARG